MTQNIEYSLAEILLKIDNRLDKVEQKIDNLTDKLEQKIDNLTDNVNNLKIDVAKLDEKIIGVDKRLSNLEFIARTVGGAIIIAVLLGIAKFLFPSFTA
jgi:murein lipoprotein